ADTWTNSLPAELIRAIAVDPSDPNRVYASAFRSGVFRSTDGGASWSKTNAGLVDLDIAALALDPSGSNRLYAGSESGGGIYRTLAAGDHWAEANAGFTNSEISTIAASGSAPGLIYAAARGRGAYAGVDGGNTWVFKSALGFGITYSFAIDPVDPNIVYQATFDGVFKTTNGGDS